MARIHHRRKTYTNPSPRRSCGKGQIICGEPQSMLPSRAKICCPGSVSRFTEVFCRRQQGELTMRIRIAAAVILALLLSSIPVFATNQCFTAFSGSVTFVFQKPVTNTTYAVKGRVFGALSSCFGLSAWPVVGSSFKSGGNVVVAFRSFTVDAPTCGATDWITNLSGSPLSGPADLHNDRTNFSNSTTLTQVSCSDVISNSRKPPAGRDVFGNGR